MEAVYIYDAVKLYALAAHEILEHDGDPRNGTKIVETITQLGRYPSDIQGINVTVDENADSEGTSMIFSVLYIFFYTGAIWCQILGGSKIFWDQGCLGGRVL